jgi:hypothetical protein
MNTRHSVDMRRGTSGVGMTDERVGLTSPRGAGGSVNRSAPEGPLGATRAGTVSGGIGARSGTRDAPQPAV